MGIRSVDFLWRASVSTTFRARSVPHSSRPSRPAPSRQQRGRHKPLSSFDTERLPVAIPIWDQYVDFLKWGLESIGDVVGSGGIAIIIFTIIVRTLILPITVRSIKSMKSMQDIQPKIKELQKKYKGDRVRLQQE